MGDTVKLVLTVEAEAVSGDMVFENLDYILDNYSMRTNGTYPNIDDYLIIE